MTNEPKSTDFRQVVLSLYDFTGEALRPWAEAGYECHAFDIQHDDTQVDTFASGGSITYSHTDLHEASTFLKLVDQFSGRNVAFGMAFPVCTDMAVSGAAWFKSKAERDPEFQTKAVNYAMMCDIFYNTLGVPFFIENPVSVLATQWRKPDHRFDPFEYGGYIPKAEAVHPRWPDYIAPFDAYPKRTCLWTGGGFKMPERKPVERSDGYSDQHKKLGGKSQRTKDIRSATPRGFAAAVHLANSGLPDVPQT